jgi:nucleotide-binding universal stress UspA family protein
MSPKRRSYEQGHTPKCLVIVDDTPECDRAVHYASRWAARNHGRMVMLRIVEMPDRNQQWLGVANLMRAEATEEAEAALERAAARAHAAGITPERLIREGAADEQILRLIDEDTDIALLVLAAGTSAEGPGPIITSLAKTIGTFPIPVTVVPGNLDDSELNALS